MTVLLLLGGCGPFFDWLTSISQVPTGANLPTDTGVTLQIENQSGIAAAVDIVYWTEAGDRVRETTRFLTATGPASVEVVLPTRAYRIHVLASAAETVTSGAGPQVQEGTVLAEANYQQGIDFEINGVVQFTIPAPNSPPLIVDCNENGITDATDIVSGFSTDCNENLIPDECDLASNPALDCDGNGVLDACDLQANPAIDCDSNGKIDACEWLDCDENGKHDPCDLLDCQGDPSCGDCNKNDKPDGCDISGGTSSDQDANGVPDECQLPEILFVDDDAPAGGDGFSWETAFSDLQDAFAVAAGAPGQVQQIWVAAGVYRPDRGAHDRSLSFDMPANVAVYGGLAGVEDPESFDLADRDFEIHETILSGELGLTGTTNDDSFHVVTAAGIGPFSILDGFTITNGFAVDAPARDGGGLYLDAASPSIWNCTFTSNVASSGGAVAMFDGSQPLFAGCTFVDNAAGLDVGSAGGAAYIGVGCDAVFFACTFDGNHAYDGGGVFADSDAVIGALECDFVNNAATNAGGGACLSGSVSSQFVSCLFSGNQATQGGGAYNYVGAPLIDSCIFVGNTATESGGGMQDDAGMPTVIWCEFSGNAATQAGGGACLVGPGSAVLGGCSFHGNNAAQGGGAYNYVGAPLIDSCSFVGNTATEGGGGMQDDAGMSAVLWCEFSGNAAGIGGGIACRQGSLATIVFSLIVDNDASLGAGGVHGSGSAPWLWACTIAGNTTDGSGGGGDFDGGSPLLAECMVFENTALSNGGGISLRGSSTPAIVNCLICLNEAGGLGGGLSAETSGTTVGVANALFSGNQSLSGGALSLATGATGSLVNCTVWANSAEDGAGAVQSSAAVASLANCIVWNNTSVPISGPVWVEYSDVEGGFPGTGNIDDEPTFVDAEGEDGTPGTLDDDLRLAADSPCIDAGDNDALPPDIADLDVDGDSSEPVPVDFGWNERRLDDPATEDSGNPGQAGAPIVDMGALEYVTDVGACCLPDGDCLLAGDSACLIVGGLPQGIGMSCDPNPCPPPATGACCISGWCEIKTQALCSTYGGTYLGDGTDCDPDPCEAPEACCLTVGDCTMALPSDCLDAGGEPQGYNSSCYPNPCLSSYGACCVQQYGCMVVSEIDCDEMDGTYFGDGSTCDPDPCPPFDPCQSDPCYAPSCPGWDPCFCGDPCSPGCPDYCYFDMCPRTDADQNGINDDCEVPPYLFAEKQLPQLDSGPYGTTRPPQS